MWQISGHDRIVNLLRGALEKGSLAHAYLLVGPPHVGKMTLALNLAQALNCEGEEHPCGECASCTRIAAGSHADVQTIGLVQHDNTEAKLISIDQIKEMLHAANLPPFEGRHKVFIIDGAEFLSTEAANCLLKTLEEPADRIVFILLATNEKLLLTTVVSRCQRLELRPLPGAGVAALLARRSATGREETGLLARLSHGCPGWALLAAEDEGILRQREEEIARMVALLGAGCEERFSYASRLAAQYSKERARVHDMLELWRDYWRDLLLVKAGCPEDFITSIDRIQELQETAQGLSLLQIKAFLDSIQAAGQQLKWNANPRLVLEVLMLDMPEGRKTAGKSPAKDR